MHTDLAQIFNCDSSEFKIFEPALMHMKNKQDIRTRKFCFFLRAGIKEINLEQLHEFTKSGQQPLASHITELMHSLVTLGQKCPIYKVAVVNG